MATECCPSSQNEHQSDQYRRVLWAVLVINACMFAVELAAGFEARSVSLQADALDFLSDTANYGISLAVVGLTQQLRAKAALTKGITMGLFGVWVLTAAIWNLVHQTTPEATTMGLVGIAALLSNGIVFALLWAYRSGDSNMQSVWLCSRNDVVGNLTVLLAALGVFGTGHGWPDVIVALVMAALALDGAWKVSALAIGELRETGA